MSANATSDSRAEQCHDERPGETGTLKALQASETRYRRLFESAQDGILILDAETGMVVDVNPFLLNLLGYSREAFLTSKVWELGFLKDAIANEDKFRELQAKDYVRYEDLPLETTDGRQIDVEFVSNVYLVNEHRVIQCNIRDITARKRAEGAMRESEQQLSLFFSQSLHGFFMCMLDEPIAWNEEGADKDKLLEYVLDHQRMTKVNQALLEQYGATKPDFVGLTVRELFRQDLDYAKELWRGLFDLGTWHTETFEQKMDGTPVVFDGDYICLYDEQGRITGHFGVQVDITARKRAETYREMGREILQILNEPGDLHESIRRVLAVLKTRTGVDAVGLRLQEGEDFPYFAEDGFPADFLQTENTLVERGKDGGVCRDKDGNVSLECTCGLVISGKTDPSNPLFTKGGSCWTNDSFPLLDLPSDQDPRLHARNNCIHQGYASVALIPVRIQDQMYSRGTCIRNGFSSMAQVPVRSSDRIVGLIQLNDKRKDRFSLETIEILEGIAAHIGSALMRKRAEDDLKESEKRFREANDASLDALLLLRSERDDTGELRDFIFTDLNRHAENMLRMSREQLLGRRLCEALPINREAGFFEKYKRVVDTGIPLQEEFFLPETHVPAAWYYHQVVKVGDGVFICHRDIGERKRAEEEREKLEAQLTQAQKMESIGRLAGGVAHDFNNLLMGIMNYVDMCRDEIGKDHPIREWLDEITHGANRSADLTRQLLAFARKQTIAPKALDLNEEVAGMLNMLRRLIGEDIDLSWQPGAELWSVKMDPGQVDQILANLCVNARDAIGGVGKVTIETQNVSIDAVCCTKHAEATPGPYVTLVVSDNGCGMDKDMLAQVFEPFFTTKGVGEGTGLGLATVYGIVKQNKGFVDVYSKPGEGATFRIYLPQFGGEHSAREEVETTEERPVGSETVMLVEDEKSVRVTTARFLEQLGYAVLTAETPSAALGLAAEHEGVIDLLITDVVMPGMSGRDLAAKLAPDHPDMKMLFISGYTANAIAHCGILEEGVHFLSKPFTRDVIARKAREILKGKQPTSKE